MYSIKLSQDNKFFVTLQAANGETLSVTEGFESKASAFGNIASQLNNSISGNQRTETVVVDFTLKTIRGWVVRRDGARHSIKIKSKKK